MAAKTFLQHGHSTVSIEDAVPAVEVAEIESVPVVEAKDWDTPPLLSILLP